jgi:hypothetical protein
VEVLAGRAVNFGVILVEREKKETIMDHEIKLLL